MRIKVIEEPPHSSDQVQALDLGIFGVQKNYKNRAKPNKMIPGRQEREIVGIIDSWRRATTPGNVVSAFRKAGIYEIINIDGISEVRANIRYTKCVRGIEPLEPPAIIRNRLTADLLRF